MKKVLSAVVLVAVIAMVGVGIARYMGYFSEDSTRNGPVIISSTPPSAEATTPPTVDQISFEIQTVLTNLSVPWSVVFTADDRLLVTERIGQVRVATLDDQDTWQLQAEPLHTFPEVTSSAEEGLMGMTLDPAYAENQYVYLCYAYPDGADLYDKVVRMVDSGTGLTNPVVVLDRIPAALFHAGCELAFGPDGKLYVSTGDATDGAIAQDFNSLGGKILRLNPDGSVPADNPFENSLVFSLGHRNPQGLDWHPTSQHLYSAEHGPSGFDGPGGGDEINLIEAGNNYGWPEVSHTESAPEFVDPKLVFTPAIAPGSLTFYDSTAIEGFSNNIFVALLKGAGILRVVLNPEDPTQVLWYERLPQMDYGRIREVTMGPDGHLYFTTSNRDGRGDPADADDRLLRIVPTQ